MLRVREVTSPRIAELRRAVANGEAGAAEKFWSEIAKAGSPLVEAADQPHRSLVTFLWRSPIASQRVSVMSWIGKYDAVRNELKQIEGTDVWFRTYRVPSNIRTIYHMAVNDPPEEPTPDVWEARYNAWFADPLNKLPKRDAHTSVVSLPKAPPRVDVRLPRPQQKGSRVEFNFHSRILGNARGVSVYLPHGFSQTHEPYPLLLMFDQRHTSRRSIIPALLDRLIAEKKIPPVVGVFPSFIDHPHRNVELPCNPQFLRAMTDELLPRVRKRFNATADPRLTVIAGGSYGGLAATYAALRAPEVFGNVLANSGSFWWKPDSDDQWEWLTREVAANGVASPFRIFAMAGTLEKSTPSGAPGVYAPSRRMMGLLRAAGCQVKFRGYAGGHDSSLNARFLPEAFTFLFAPAMERGIG